MPARLAGLRRLGWFLVAIGLSVPAIGLPVRAWFVKGDSDQFNSYVGWANVLSLTVAVVGVLIVIADRIGALGDYSLGRIQKMADELAVKVRSEQSFRLAQLLGTDSLDRRTARVRYSVTGKRVRAKAKKKSTPVPDVGDIEGIVGFYSTRTRGRLVILGAAGSGKTVLSSVLLLGLLRERGQGQSVENVSGLPHVPIMASLSLWDVSSQSFSDWISDVIARRYQLGLKAARRLLDGGWILPILDGLDEMDAHGAPAFKADGAVKQINDYIASTDDCRIIVVCRSGPRYYDRLSQKIRDADEITIKSLNAQEISGYLNEQCDDALDVESWAPVYEALEDSRSSTMCDVLGTPWRLTAALTFYLAGGPPSDLAVGKRLGSKKPVEVSRIKDRLISGFLTGKIEIYERGRPTVARTVQSLIFIATMMKDPRRNELNVHEISPHEWWKILGAKAVRKVHVTVTFIALHLPIIVLTLAGIHQWVPPVKSAQSGLFLLLQYGANYVTIFCIFQFRAARDRRPSRFSIRGVRNPKIAAIVAVGAILSAGTGYVTATVFGWPRGVATGVLMMMMIFFMATSAAGSLVPHVRPCDVLKNDRNVTLLTGLTIGALAYLYYLTAFDGITLPIIFSSMCFVGYIVSSAYARYLASAFYGWSIFRFPLRFVRFLEWGSISGVMRATGGGYEFRHQEVVDYLAARSE